MKRFEAPVLVAQASLAQLTLVPICSPLSCP